MATVNAELYEALLEAGASQEKARKAAENLAAYDSRFGKIERDTATNSGKVEQRMSRTDIELAAIRSELTLLKWMTGFVLVGVSTLIVRALF